MTFVERYEEFKWTLLEMSFGQKDSLGKIENKLPQLTLHIMKILITKDDIELNLNHWNTELNNFINDIVDASNVKTKRGIRMKTLIANYHYFYKKCDYFDDLKDRLKRKYTILPHNEDSLLKILKNFYENELFPCIEKRSFKEFRQQNFAQKFYRLRSSVLI